MLQLDGGLSEDERIKLSRIFMAGEDTADLTSETITGSSHDVLTQAVRKSDEITIEESSREKVVASLKIMTHPDLFTRGHPITQQERRDKTILTWTEVLESLPTDSRTSI